MQVKVLRSEKRDEERGAEKNTQGRWRDLMEEWKPGGMNGGIEEQWKSTREGWKDAMKRD